MGLGRIKKHFLKKNKKHDEERPHRKIKQAIQMLRGMMKASGNDNMDADVSHDDDDHFEQLCGSGNKLNDQKRAVVKLLMSWNKHPEKVNIEALRKVWRQVPTGQRMGFLSEMRALAKNIMDSEANKTSGSAGPSRGPSMTAVIMPGEAPVVEEASNAVHPEIPRKRCSRTQTCPAGRWMMRTVGSRLSLGRQTSPGLDSMRSLRRTSCRPQRGVTKHQRYFRSPGSFATNS
ncbi:unnamed protein product [Prorocentrum cordatum]|uniref:Uncharacterized protein n=1 Tax=Prorocentrum cordatum TaxID=2364126 RepID=A0ABN9QP01_9DINO|nr:unnamed protein product [Polarella glacialis]